jgi:hypothetical protein
VVSESCIQACPEEIDMSYREHEEHFCMMPVTTRGYGVDIHDQLPAVMVMLQVTAPALLSISLAKIMEVSTEIMKIAVQCSMGSDSVLSHGSFVDVVGGESLLC